MRLRGNSELLESGVLLHITSLPSRYGVGTFGREAYRFVDFLKSSGQRYWQILPICPVGEGNSPYKSISCFAGEPLFIDLEFLVRDGFLNISDLPDDFGEVRVDYDKAAMVKMPLLKKAASAFKTNTADYLRFSKKNEFWLDDYAVFMTIVEQCKVSRLCQFEEDILHRNSVALENFKAAYCEEIEEKKIIQYFFYSQYFALKTYAAKNGVRIIGDLPFYVSLDSVDVWSAPENFKLGNDMTPVLVSGVPPDNFSAEGQLWGNPLYDWDYQRHTDYSWWIRRIEYALSLYDVLRIDHFRAFADYYTIPYGAKDARSGSWEKGAGISFWHIAESKIIRLHIITEDLGEVDYSVEQLVKETGFPNTKVLQFAFDGNLKNKHLPRNYVRNCVCYTGTHDNNTALGWYKNATAFERDMLERLTSSSGLGNPSHKMIWLAMHSRADTVIVPMQDWLCLDESARMNFPGTARGNWEWRMPSDYYADSLISVMKTLSVRR